jgi:NADH:ubiquinone oxidoreductase subunit F (NADH-binding)
MMERLERSNNREDTHAALELEVLNQVVAEASLCALGQMAPNPIRSAIRYFGAQVVSPPAISIK